MAVERLPEGARTAVPAILRAYARSSFDDRCRRGDSESHTWQELEEVFAALGQLARSSIAPPEFYRSVLDQSVRALSAVGGAVWLRGRRRAAARSRKRRGRAASLLRDEQARRAHEALLIDAAAEGRVVSVSPASERSGTAIAAIRRSTCLCSDRSRS